MLVQLNNYNNAILKQLDTRIWEFKKNLNHCMTHKPRGEKPPTSDADDAFGKTPAWDYWKCHND